jgi:2-keto-3-deoxy-L-rhamnonate aldolase RhmA
VAENIFKRWLQGEGPKPPLGTWLMSGAASTAEALGHAGMDWLCIDMEHVPIDVPDTLDILRAIANTPAQAVGAAALERAGDGQARARHRRCHPDVPLRADA